MPFGDGTGPQGMGPMTGRGAGYCAGFSMPGTTNGLGRGFFGRGRGRGWRNRFYATGLPGWARSGYGSAFPEMSARQESEILKNQARLMESELQALKERIGSLEKAETPSKEN